MGNICLGQFETSEGTFCAQVGTAGFFALPMSKRRKALHGVMEQLEKEVADGHVNEGAHVRLCKRLKKAFNASGDKRKHIKEYLLEALTDDPIASMSVPVSYRDIMEDPDFLQELVKKKGEDTADGKVPDEWWRDLLSGLLPDWMLDQIADTDFLVGSRGIVGVLLAADIDALPEALLTVWYNVMERGRLSAGETVLIHGGSSGIGSIGIQMAATLGANVISTAGSVARCDAVKALGASFVANHREGSLIEQITEAGYGGKVDVILDIAGGDLMQANLDLAALDGRIVCIGVMRGMQSEINLATLFMKRLTLTGSTLRRLDRTERARCFTAIRDRIWPQVIAGNIQPIVDTAYPLADVLEAHEHMRLGTHLGKLVLDCRMG